MIKIIPYLVCLLLLSSCLSRNEVLRQPGVRQPAAPKAATTANKPAGSTSNAGYSYISQYKDVAIAEMNRYGIPASIKLAQGMLESGNGSSRLATQANNHFGIKCTPEWSGGKTYQADDTPNDCFRVYKHPRESFRDHSEFLLRRRYEKLFELKKDDYRGWARGLKEAGYATNPRYADLLISLIERYELHKYDRPEQAWEQNRRVESVEKEIAVNTLTKPQQQNAHPAVKMKIHEVKAGETLTKIAAQYQLTIEEVAILNGLTGREVQVGQLLIVSK